MSGRKQHYVPQFLLRGVAAPGGGKHPQVVVHSRTRGTYRTPTQGVGAQRAFYSDPANGTTGETLDDRITAHETPLAEFVQDLRTAAPGAPVASQTAADAVTHLAIRTAHVREAFASGMADILAKVEDRLADPANITRLLKMHETPPGSAILRLLREFWGENKSKLQQSGLTKDGFERKALGWLRANAADALAQATPLLPILMQMVRERLADGLREPHVRALKKGLVPAPRAEALAQLAWRVEGVEGAGWVLPDCVAVAMLDDGDCLPLAFAEPERIRLVALPLSTDRVLLGVRDDAPCPAPDAFAAAAAEASWDWLVTRHDGPELAALTSRIGTRTRSFLQAAVGDGLKETGGGR